MCLPKTKVPMPPEQKAPTIGASAPAAAVLNTKTVDFDAVDSDSATLKKKSKGKKQFRIAKNDMGTPMSGSGLSIPKSA
tara:strand:- start:8423 stop:8659 length:237 start_codon:yes stop_codon:yes gene_type:complete